MFLAFNYYIIREINRQNLFNMTFQTAGQIHLLFLDGIFIHGKKLLQVNVIWLMRANQNHTLYADMRDCN